MRIPLYQHFNRIIPYKPSIFGGAPIYGNPQMMVRSQPQPRKWSCELTWAARRKNVPNSKRLVIHVLKHVYLISWRWSKIDQYVWDRVQTTYLCLWYISTYLVYTTYIIICVHIMYNIYIYIHIHTHTIPPLYPPAETHPPRKVWLPMLMPPLGRSGWVMMEAPVWRRLTRAWAIFRNAIGNWGWWFQV